MTRRVDSSARPARPLDQVNMSASATAAGVSETEKLPDLSKLSISGRDEASRPGRDAPSSRPAGDPMLARLRRFCEARGINTDRVTVLTVQRNRTSSFFSLVIDWQADKLLKLYPAEALVSYKEIVVKDPGNADFLVCFNDTLPAISEVSSAAPEGAKYVMDNPPFCCGGIYSYKPRPLQMEQPFRDLVSGSGNHPDLAFEIKRQVNNGPLLSTRYFSLVDGKILEVDGPFDRKAHAFKNYKCDKHNLFFGVDLYRTGSGGDYNFHHMRLNPFEHRNEGLMESLFKAAGTD